MDKVEKRNHKSVPIRTCSCGFEFHELPEDGILQENNDGLDGYYWNCELCRSTLFLPKGLLPEAA